MEKTLIKEVAGIEVTDELIAINKRYQKLGDIYDAYDKLIETIKIAYTFGSAITKEELNSPIEIETQKHIAKVEKMQDAVAKEMSKIYKEVNEAVFLSKMLRGAMMLKAFKEVEKEEKAK